MITIVDYGLGNIKAFANVYKRLNIDCCYAKDVSALSRASKIILPGVGAFDHAMDKLNKSGLRDCLDELVLDKKVPVMGICVGMQMMADASDEGVADGLSWIKGRVRRFSYENEKIAQACPLPHMGWNNIQPQVGSALLHGLDEAKRFYFLHSYYFDAADAASVVATANYGIDYACLVNRDNIYGIQCHPEKSHHNGVALLNNFANL